MKFDISSLEKKFPHVGVRHLLMELEIPLPPKRQGWSSEKFLGICKLISENKRNPDLPFKIGADPEFEVYQGETFIPAHRTFLERGGTRGRVGVDGDGDIGEIRPSPGSPEKVVKNIAKLLKKIRNNFPFDYELKSG